MCIYLTDGYGDFPPQSPELSPGLSPELPPELPGLWVVTPGGLDLSKFPFGEAVRLLSVTSDQ